MIKWDFFQGCKEFFGINKTINVMHHINKLKNKNDMIILIDAEKAFDKIQQSLMIKSLQKIRIEGTNLNTIKAYMTNPQLASHSMVKN